MEAIASALSDAEFVDIQDLETAYEARVGSLKGKFDDMRMVEDENIEKYGQRIKEVVAAIKSVGGTIEEDDVVSKVLRTLLPLYAIRVSAIQE